MFNSLDGGVPGDDLRKIFCACQRMAKVPNAAEKIVENYNCLSRVHERFRRQTDGRAAANSERERKFTFAKKQ